MLFNKYVLNVFIFLNLSFCVSKMNSITCLCIRNYKIRNEIIYFLETIIDTLELCLPYIFVSTL